MTNPTNPSTQSNQNQSTQKPAGQADKNQQGKVGDNTRKDDIRDANKTGGMKSDPTGTQKPGQGSKVA